jgi:hypothetical protein
LSHEIALRFILNKRQNYTGGASGGDPGVGRAVTHLCLLDDPMLPSRRRACSSVSLVNGG